MSIRWMYCTGIYLTCTSIILVVLPIDTEGSTSPSSNCTSNTTLKSSWRKEEYPNPKTDISQCGRDCKPSSICDPGHAISTKEGKYVFIYLFFNIL